jgi:branched-chain amino acid transport system substrate-binding protein
MRWIHKGPLSVWAWVSLVVLLVMSVVAIGASAAAADVVIGAALSLTGDFALTGLQQKNGIDLAVEEANAQGGVKGQKIRIEYADNAMSPSVAVNALNRVLSANPAAVLLTVRGTHILPQLPFINKASVPGLTITGTRKVTQQGSPWLFRFYPHDGMAKRAMTLFAVEKLDKRRVAIIHVADEYGQSGRDTIIATLKEKGLAPVVVESNQSTDKDMSPQLLKVKNSGADVLLIQNHHVPCAILLRQIRQYALNIPVVASASCAFRDTLELVSAEDVEGMYAETSVILRSNPDPAVRGWADRMRARFKSEPDEMALLEYDVTRTLIEVMRQYGTDPKDIQKGLKEITYDGLMMKYASDSEGNMGRQIIIGQVRKKELLLLERYQFSKADSEKL